jgi:hypothetical protein
MIIIYFHYEEKNLYITVLDSDDERELVIEAEENRDITAADVAKYNIIYK